MTSSGAPALPTGTVTFLFTDIEGSTQLARAYPGTWDSALAQHDARLRAAIAVAHGHVFEAAGDGFENVVLFQSLSKRSNLPGLRIGFAMGDRRFIAKFLELRNVAAPQVPIPTQEVAVAAYGDEVHVEANRDLYRQKFDLADQIIGDRYGHRRPAGGFFLWLDVGALGGSEAATAKLWRDAGVRDHGGSAASHRRRAWMKDALG